ncbi:MAG: methyltransferase type 11 [Planctomycetaceae bacterium]|nr:methyltransferase type 11 [Planctomycetaceae bacterium]
MEDDVPETIDGNIYDYPKYYDLVFASDWRAEFDFLNLCFERFAKRPVKKLFEPACGTGRLLIKFAQSGFNVRGNDLNPKAIDFCNDRLERFGFGRSAIVGDMSDFRLKGKADAAFNTINSFRHLGTEKMAEAHLKCMANALAKGGLYLLGLHLTPTEGVGVDQESWSARRGNLMVVSNMWTKKVDLKVRREYLGMTFDVYTLTKHFRIEDSMEYRTYTAAQMCRLLKKVPEFEVVETFDFAYDIKDPVTINSTTEDVVFVLRKK